MAMNICEIFHSIQGESSYAGLPCTFIRLAGCNLRCRYCDTTYALGEGKEMSIEQVLDQALAYKSSLVEITGGEPLFQPETPRLARALLDRGREILIETNGSLDISVLPDGVTRIMDIKCPSSGENHRIMWENLWKLTPDDEVKFVVADRHDYEWARGIINDRFGITKTKILLSTVFGELPPRNLVEWMLADGLQARFQLQIHKFIWPHGKRGV
jgi:7-carboxy-7-deazaguanine synthase